MIYKSNSDGQWHKVNPDFVPFNIRQDYVRRKAFSSGIFRIDRDGGSYHLFVKNWSIGAWSPGDTERARMLINSSFHTYYAMTR